MFALGADLSLHAQGAVGHKPGTALSSSTEALSAAIDCKEMAGQQLTALLLLGDVTGTPTSVAVAFKITECDTSGGTYTDITGASAALAASATGNNGTATYVVTGIRSKRYIKLSATPTFVGGTSPTQPIASYLFGQKQRP